MDDCERAILLIKQAKRRIRDRERYAKRNRGSGEPYTDHGSVCTNARYGRLKQK